MDLGATVCRPKAPRLPCLPAARPVRRLRERHARGFPAAKAKRARPLRHGTAWWTERDGNVWLVRRPAQGAARRNGRASGKRLVGRAPTRFGRDARHRPPRLHPFRARPSARAARRAGRTAAGGIRSTGWAKRDCRASTAAPPQLALARCARRLMKLERPRKGRPNPNSTRLPKTGKNFMDDRFNTIAGWVLFAGIVALGSSIVAGEFFHSERPEKMGYPIAGVAQEGEGGAAAEQPIEVYLAKADPAKGGRRVQEMRRLPQCREGRPQPARAQSVGRDRRADRPGPGLRFLRRSRQEGRDLELGQSQPVADQPESLRRPAPR